MIEKYRPHSAFVGTIGRKNGKANEHDAKTLPSIAQHSHARGRITQPMGQYGSTAMPSSTLRDTGSYALRTLGRLPARCLAM